jgi:threonyl-tRNA synthetase
MLVKEFKWFSPSKEMRGAWIWHPKAEALRQILREFWRKNHEEQDLAFLATPYKTLDQEAGEIGESITQGHVEYLLENPCEKVTEMTYVQGISSGPFLEGLFSPLEYFLDLAHLTAEGKDLLKESISSLQFITKIPKIFRFEFKLVLCVASAENQRQAALWKRGVALLQEALRCCGFEHQVERHNAVATGPRIEVRLVDALGRFWAGPFLRFDCRYSEKLGKSLLVRSSFGPLERFMALLIEKHQGKIPDDYLKELNGSKDSESEN